MPTSAVATSSASNPVAAFLHDALRIFFGPHRAVFLLACSTGLLFLGTYGLMGTFLSEVCGLTPTQAGLVMMLYGVFCLVGGALSWPLGGRARPWPRYSNRRGIGCDRRAFASGFCSFGKLGACARGGSVLGAGLHPCSAHACHPLHGSRSRAGGALHRAHWLCGLCLRRCGFGARWRAAADRRLSAAVGRRRALPRPSAHHLPSVSSPSGCSCCALACLRASIYPRASVYPELRYAALFALVWTLPIIRLEREEKVAIPIPMT